MNHLELVVVARVYATMTMVERHVVGGRRRLLVMVSFLFVLLSCCNGVSITSTSSAFRRRRLTLATTRRHETSRVVNKALQLRGGDRAPWVDGLRNSMASALAAACSKTILAPFDTIKTMQQQYHATSGASSLGFLEAARLIMSRPNGFWELYAGLGVAVLGSMPSVGFYFGVYSYSKRTLGPALQNAFGSSSENAILQLSDNAIFTLTIAASAAIGNTVASFSRVPYEVVKQKLQTGQYPNTWIALKEMATSGKLSAFFPMGSVSIQMIRDIPYAMVTLLSYEYIRQHSNWKENLHAALFDMGAGAVAGGIGSYLTNPLDVIKTRLQTDPDLYGGSVASCFEQTWQEGGPQAFLRGSVPRLLHKVPANGFFFVFYELFQRILP